ncbi:hypothetical protein [Lacunimicrobium album]
MTIQEILAAAEELSPAEQAELFGVIIERYSPVSVPVIAELERRRREMRENSAMCIDGPTAMAEVRTSIRRRA